MSLASFLHWLLSSLKSMDVPSWYSFVSASILAVWLFCLYLCLMINSRWPRITSIVMRKCMYPNIFPRIPFVGTATPFQVFIVFLYLLANLLIVVIGPRAEMGSRAATMSIINLIPLLCGPRLSLVTRLLGISYRASIGSHQWFGRTAIAQMLLHTVLSLTGSTPFRWTRNSITGAVASSAIGFILLLSTSIFKRVLYECFLNSHLLLSIVVLIAIWCHASSKKPSDIFLRIGIYLWTAASVSHWTRFAFRNFVFGRPFARAVAIRLSNKALLGQALVDPSNVLQVDVTVPRPWHVKAGQFIFLSIPRLGIFTGLRGHPFMISWWERGGGGLKLSLLVKSRAGFTAELDRYANQKLLAFVDGPYGVRHDFGEYGTVIMLATGIGIAGHLPYIKDLIIGYNNCAVKTHRIRLLWEIKEQCQEMWVKHWMDELLEMDTGYMILEITVHGKEDKEYGDHSRIKETSFPLDVVGTLKAEIKKQRGMIMVSLCADKFITDRARNHVKKNGGKWVRLVELEFQPSLRETGRLFPTEMEFQCIG